MVVSILFSLVKVWPYPAIAQIQDLNNHQDLDIPEEILETEIILDARSPINGQPLTPADYAKIQDELRQARGDVPGRVAPKIHQALVLLRLRKVLDTLFPFLF